MDSITLGLLEPLDIESIDFRIQSINNSKYATILAYKDARVDMDRLDDVVGALNWKREHTRENRNCTVSIYNSKTNEWVSKEDTGTESNTEAEKGLASDSFKRACFNWGIGRELYNYPVISIKLNDYEVKETGKDRPKYKASYKLNINNWKWYTVFVNGELIQLSCKDTEGKVRFNWKHEKFDELKPKPELTVEGLKFLCSEKATKEDIQKALKERTTTPSQKTALENILKLG